MKELEKIISIVSDIDKTESEEQIKNTFVSKLLNWLKAPQNNLAFEFPVWNYSDKNHSKRADIVIFSNNAFGKHRQNRSEDIRWVNDHCLLVIETKRPEKLSNAFFQAKYYSDNLRSIAYMIIDGKTIEGYMHKEGISDQLILDCKVSELTKNIDSLLHFRYEKLIELKDQLLEKQNEEVENYSLYYPNGLRVPKPIDYIPRTILEIDADENDKLSLAETIEKDNKIIIVDNAGTGKTYELQHTAWELYENKKYLPVYYSLANYTGQEIDKIESDVISVSEHPRSVFLLDGYDEIDSDHFSIFAKKLNDYVQRMNKNRIVVTSRSNFYSVLKDNKRRELFKGFAVYTLLPLGDDDIKKYLELNGVVYNKFEEEIVRHKLKEIELVPFFLCNLCRLYKERGTLPTKSKLMLTLLENCLENDLNKYELTLPNIEDKKIGILNVLSKLGYAMQCLKVYSLKNEDYLKLFSLDQRDLLKYSSIWKKDKDIWSFEHNHFQEFLAAYYLKNWNIHELQNTITYSDNPKKIKESWMNTVNHLLSISDNDDLLNWIVENDAEALFYLENAVLDEVVSESVFDALFTKYSDAEIVIQPRGPEMRGMVRLAEDAKRVAYLVNVLNNQHDNISIINALRILKEVSDYGLYVKEIRKSILNLIENKNDNTLFYNSIKCLSNPALFAEDDLQFIIQHARTSDEKLSVLYYIRGTKQCDRGISFAADMLNYGFPEELFFSVVLSIEEIINNITKPESIIAVLEKYPTDINDRYFRNTKLITTVFDKVSELYTEENVLLLETVFDFYFRSIIGYSNTHFDYINRFLTTTGNNLKCYKYMAKKHPEVFNYYRFILIDKNNLLPFIFAYENDELPEQDYFVSYCRQLSPDDANFVKVSEVIYKKSGERITGLKHIDYKAEELKAAQEIFDALFSVQTYKFLITEFLAKMKLDENATFKQLNKVEMDIWERKTKWQLLCSYLDEVSIVDKEIINYPDEPSWLVYSLLFMSKLLQRYNEIEIQKEQNRFICASVNKLMNEISWDDEVRYINNRFNCSNKAYLVAYLSSRLSLDLTEEQYRNLLCLPKELFHGNDTNSFLPKYITDHLSENQVLQTILINIDKGLVTGNLAFCYISYCRKIKSNVVVKLADDILSDPGSGQSEKWVALVYLSDLGYSAELVNKYSGTEDADLLRFMAEYLSGIELPKDAVDKLIDRLVIEHKKKQDGWCYIPELIAMNNRYAIEVYADFIRSYNIVPEKKAVSDKYITETIAKISDISLLDLTLELFILSYKNGFIDDEVTGLRGATSKAILNLAEEHYAKVREQLIKIKENSNDNKLLLSQCSYILKDMDAQHYRQEDKPVEMKDIMKQIAFWPINGNN